MPSVFHMCWTQSRADKVKYFKELGLWFLPVSSDGDEGDGKEKGKKKAGKESLQVQCESPPAMLSWVTEVQARGERADIRKKCCMTGDYFAKKKKKEGGKRE